MRHHLLFAALLLGGAAVYFDPVSILGRLLLRNDSYSHIVLIPTVSVSLLGMQRRSVFAAAQGNRVVGSAVCAAGLALYGAAVVMRDSLPAVGFRSQSVPNDYLTLSMAGVVAWVIGSFIAAYGTEAFRAARFPLLFLLFTIPLPMFFLNGIVRSLQYASAEAADIVLGLIGVPYYRNGLVFEFSRLTVQVAEECSGIRSSLSLLILSVITGALFLRTASRRVVLALTIFPITVLKNAFRIATITLLANYVDMRYVSNHWIHSSGGIPFFAVALSLFIPLVWVLRRSEERATARRGVR
jgi:exosortase